MTYQMMSFPVTLSDP